jgi:ACS family tartrate transporter-like MFS transporter
MAGIYFNSAHSDKTGERFWHIALPAGVAAAAILAAWSAGPGPIALLALLLAGIGLGAAQGAFWALPTRMLTRSTLAVAAVAINIAGSSGGFVMPHLVGYALERSGGFGAPSALIAAMLASGAVLVLSMRALGTARVSHAGSS